ncbi:MAG: diphosphomevalonate decarboxylase [Anaerolineales bacterium]|nr:diphosphomevalonate decarboxylase [Anaerolineales bacterium]
MNNFAATAIAFPNIAFIKYWGNCEPGARLPANGSISMNLSGLHTRTQVSFAPRLETDQFVLDGQNASPPALQRVSAFLDHVRQMAGVALFARVVSENNFPTGAGIASSASGFAALALAASRAAGLELDEQALSRLARRGSGSACRSVPGGFVEWQVDACDPDSGALSIAPPEHWNLADCIAIVSQGHKPVGSTEGHAIAHTSPIQAARVAGAPRRIELCRRAILDRDFDALANVVELDSNLMHAVMMTSTPRLLYWRPATLAVMQAVAEWRYSGLPACYTIDAGPNVHVICPSERSGEVAGRLRQVSGVQAVLTAHPGGPARYIYDDNH